MEQSIMHIAHSTVLETAFPLLMHYGAFNAVASLSQIAPPTFGLYVLRHQSTKKEEKFDFKGYIAELKDFFFFKKNQNLVSNRMALKELFLA